MFLVSDLVGRMEAVLVLFTGDLDQGRQQGVGKSVEGQIAKEGRSI